MLSAKGRRRRASGRHSEHPRDQSGWSKTYNAGWATLTATASWLLAVVSTAVPFLAIEALPVVVTIYRRRLRRASAPPSGILPAANPR